MNLDLRTSEPFAAGDFVLATLHARLLEHALNARAYQAEVAGLDMDIEATATGFRISIHGYSDKLSLLFDDVLTAFIDAQSDSDVFAAVRATLRREYANLSSAPPYEQMGDSLYRLIHSHGFPLTALVEAADGATLATLAAWRRDALVDLGATLFGHGNLHAKDAQTLAASAQRRLGIVDRPHHAPRAKRLVDARRYEHSVDHDDAVYLLYLQGESDSMDDLARLGLIGRMVGARYFTALRTERQLGYVVGAYANPIARHAGLVFIVQASRVGVAAVEALTRQFLEDQRSWFRELSRSEFEAYRDGYIAPLERPSDFNQHERTTRLLDDLTHGVLTFDSKMQLRDAVASLEAVDVADAYDALIDPARGNRLTVYSRGKPGTEPSDGEPITSIEDFERTEVALP